MNEMSAHELATAAVQAMRATRASRSSARIAGAVLEALHRAGYAVIELPEPYPDETVHPYWSVKDINGPQVIRVTDGDESEDWVSIEFSARNRYVDASTARALAAALLAAADAAEHPGTPVAASQQETQ